MRRIYLLSVVLLLGIVAGSIWWIQRETPPVSSESSAPGANTGSASNISGTRSADGIFRSPDSVRNADRLDEKLTVADIAERARELNSPTATVQDDLQIVQSLLDFFRHLNNGVNPSGGLNEEIVDQLRGKNAKRFAVIPPDLSNINAEGQLLDRWGTPYYFHPISGKEMEIRSAGPDKRLWTNDDVEERL